MMTPSDSLPQGPFHLTTRVYLLCSSFPQTIPHVLCEETSIVKESNNMLGRTYHLVETHPMLHYIDYALLHTQEAEA